MESNTLAESIDRDSAHLVYLNADGWEIESDFYLKLAHDITQIIRGKEQLSPIQPRSPYYLIETIFNQFLFRFGKLECVRPAWKLVAEDQCLPSCGNVGGKNSICQSKPCEEQLSFESYDCKYCCMSL